MTGDDDPDSITPTYCMDIPNIPFSTSNLQVFYPASGHKQLFCSVSGFPPSAHSFPLPTLVTSDKKSHWCNQYETETA